MEGEAAAQPIVTRMGGDGACWLRAEGNRAGSQSDVLKQLSRVDFRGPISNCPGGTTINFQCGWWQWQVSDSSSG